MKEKYDLVGEVLFISRGKQKIMRSHNNISPFRDEKTGIKQYFCSGFCFCVAGSEKLRVVDNPEIT